MTEQERELLNNLLANLVATPTTQKDFEAGKLPQLTPLTLRRS